MTYVYELYMIDSQYKTHRKKIYRKNPITKERKEKLVWNYCRFLIKKYNLNGLLEGCNLIEERI